ncbi:MaoC family dehydratase N-terminal domain-containing protein [Paraburkholderia sp. B3]|uniref:FAS1-like dehydratase domain-containing protein n=1 Tax=Paraburkholderia sp. B3 TaxID=3134791 RepID=UPI003981AED4
MQDSGTIQDWLGRTETVEERVAPFPAAAFAAMLDRPAPQAVLPPLWHWFHFLQAAPRSQQGPDGHPRRGGFLPPVPLPRRMWAGGRLRFLAPVKIGERAVRESTIAAIEDKTGRSGRLVFVTVQHCISMAGELCIEEEQDIVYREAPAPGAPAPKPIPAPDGEHWRRTIETDPVLLFRYSALTFNGHRIHYDQPYATREEGYPGLVVHGPLIATLLLDLAVTELGGAVPAHFSFRAVRPTFVGQAFSVCGRRDEDGRTVELWAKDREGCLTMQASAEFA